jgi:hypothetical protein
MQVGFFKALVGGAHRIQGFELQAHNAGDPEMKNIDSSSCGI